MASSQSQGEIPPRRSNRINSVDYTYRYVLTTGYIEREVYEDNRSDSTYIPSSASVPSSQESIPAAEATLPPSQDSDSTSQSGSSRGRRSDAPPPSSQPTAPPPYPETSGTTLLSNSSRGRRSDAPSPSSQSDDATAFELEIFEDPPSTPPHSENNPESDKSMEDFSSRQGLIPQSISSVREPLVPITLRNGRPNILGNAQKNSKYSDLDKERGNEKKGEFSLTTPAIVVNSTGEVSNDDGATSSRPSRLRVQDICASAVQLREDEEHAESAPNSPHHHD